MLAKRQQDILNTAAYCIDDWYNGQPCEAHEWLGITDAQADELVEYTEACYRGTTPALPAWIPEWLEIGDTNCLCRLGCRVHGNDLSKALPPRGGEGISPMQTMAALGAFKWPTAHTPW